MVVIVLQAQYAERLQYNIAHVYDAYPSINPAHLVPTGPRALPLTSSLKSRGRVIVYKVEPGGAQGAAGGSNAAGNATGIAAGSAAGTARPSSAAAGSGAAGVQGVPAALRAIKQEAVDAAGDHHMQEAGQVAATAAAQQQHHHRNHQLGNGHQANDDDDQAGEDGDDGFFEQSSSDCSEDEEDEDGDEGQGAEEQRAGAAGVAGDDDIDDDDEAAADDAGDAAEGATGAGTSCQGRQGGARSKGRQGGARSKGRRARKRINLRANIPRPPIEKVVPYKQPRLRLTLFNALPSGSSWQPSSKSHHAPEEKTVLWGTNADGEYEPIDDPSNRPIVSGTRAAASAAVGMPAHYHHWHEPQPLIVMITMNNLPRHW